MTSIHSDAVRLLSFMNSVIVLRTGSVSPSISLQIAVIKVLIQAFHNQIVWIKCQMFSDSQFHIDFLQIACLLIGCLVFY